MSDAGTINDQDLIKIYGKEMLLRLNNLLEKCKSGGIKLTTIESLTGGGIGYFLTSLAGTSAMVDSGYIVYCNRAKIRLGVNEEDLKIHEAVSEPVARQMAYNALKKSEANIAVSVTGYASEVGDESRNIQGGTVFIGVAVRQSITDEPVVVEVSEHHFLKQRTACRSMTIKQALAAFEKAVDNLIHKEPLVECSGSLVASGLQHELLR